MAESPLAARRNIMKTLLNTLNANQKETLNAVIKMVKEHLDYFEENEIVICQNGIRYEGWYYGEPANVVCVYGEEPYINYYEEDENIDDKLVDFTDEEINAEKAMQEESFRPLKTGLVSNSVFTSTFCPGITSSFRPLKTGLVSNLYPEGYNHL